METEEDDDTSVEQVNQAKSNDYGILPYILKYCEVTNHTLIDVFKQPCTLVFYVVSYEIELAKKQEKEIKKIQNRYRSLN